MKNLSTGAFKVQGILDVLLDMQYHYKKHNIIIAICYTVVWHVASI